MFQSILVVCIGNICRSPIGEVLLANRLLNHDPNILVNSAGLSALVNYPADKIAQELMSEQGFDLSSHRAQQLSPELAFGAELILTMTADQERQVVQAFPSTTGRVHRLGKWGGFDVPDPFQRPRVIFEHAFALIEQGVDEWYRKLWA